MKYVVCVPDGAAEHTYALGYSIVTVDGTSRYVFLPPDGDRSTSGQDSRPRVRYLRRAA